MPCLWKKLRLLLIKLSVVIFDSPKYVVLSHIEINTKIKVQGKFYLYLYLLFEQLSKAQFNWVIEISESPCDSFHSVFFNK